MGFSCKLDFFYYSKKKKRCSVFFLCPCNVTFHNSYLNQLKTHHQHFVDYMLFTLLCIHSLLSSRIFFQANNGQPGVLIQPFEHVYFLNRGRQDAKDAKKKKKSKRIGPKYVSIARMWYIHTV